MCDCVTELLRQLLQSARPQRRCNDVPDGCFAEEDGIVLRAAAENLDDAFDFVFASDDGIHFAFAGDLGQVAAKRFKRGSFNFAFFLNRSFLSRTRFGGGLFFLRGKIGIEFLQDFLAGLFDVDVEIFQDACGDAVTFAEQAEQDVFGADIGVVQVFGLLGGERETFFTRGV